MNREIKFRAWDKRNKEMVYSDQEDCFYVNRKGVLFMYALPKSETGLETKYLKSYDVMQYTGLKDKQGKEIYEGDIIFIERMNDKYKSRCEDENNVVIWVEDFATFGTDKDRVFDWVRFHNKYEIVGNIHEHKTLTATTPHHK